MPVTPVDDQLDLSDPDLLADHLPLGEFAWLRQNQPKIPASEMGAIRALWLQAYGRTTVLMTGDNQLFIKNLPKLQPGKPPFQLEDWKGDWSLDGATYTLHVSLNGADKYLSATTEGLRLSIKDGKTLLIFDRAN